MSLFGGIEAGGTKIVCVVGSGPEDLKDEIRFQTTTPTETIQKAIDYFSKQNKKESLSAIGIGSFGPVDLNVKSPLYGYITSTTKPGWSNTNFLGMLKEQLNIPIGFDTDVNAAALGEYKWGAAKELNNFLYLTIGTGIGGGAVVSGKLIHGLMHTEMGHIFIPHDIISDPYKGNCPFHNDCFEGLASGPAIKERWGKPAEELCDDHKAWELQAKYISLALSNYVCTLSPERIIIGGGVMEKKLLFPMIRKNVPKLLNGYIGVDEILNDIDHYIVPPKLGNKAGILGAIALAEDEFINSLK